MPELAFCCTNVSKQFKNVRANDNINLEVEAKQIFGILGPNGSGKTTLLNQLQGLDAPTSGTVSVLGLDPQTDREKLMSRIGTQLQESALIPRLTVKETLQTYSSFYTNSKNLEEVLNSVGLAEKLNERVDKLSGGQRQRVFIALALIHDPELLFFDELTSALDPKTRLTIWEILKQLKTDGRSIVLTTHSMEEAQTLCDRIAILNHGRIIALDTPENLIAQHAGATTLTAMVADATGVDTLLDLPNVNSVLFDGTQLTVTGTGDFAPAVLAQLTEPKHVELKTASLEDAFLNLTGSIMEDEN